MATLASTLGRKPTARSLSLLLLPRRSIHSYQPQPTGVVVELRRRGFVQDLTSENFTTKTLSPTSIYLGVDPSARSLHAGNLLALLALLHFQNHGHQAIALIGGATGSIGDPSGRSSERNFLSLSDLDDNVASITNQITTFFQRGQDYAAKRRAAETGVVRVGEVLAPKVVNNLDWTRDISLLDFLRTVGKGAKVQTMLNRDSVRSRLSSESGISFTEFTYQLLQAHDFLHLHLEHGCSAQIGGSDQLGNIQAGMDLISRHYFEQSEKDKANTKTKTPQDGASKRAVTPAAREQVFGLTIPLLTTATGEKFGKSVGNPVWLDERMTSVFDFYQFFVRALDTEVERYLKVFTLLSVERIDEIMTEHLKDAGLRTAQTILAAEVTELVHGESGVQKALIASSVLYQTSLSDLTTDGVLSAFENDPRLVRIPRSALPVNISKLAATHKVVGSRRAAIQILTEGGVTLNGNKIVDGMSASTFGEKDLLDGRLAVLRVGKTGNLVVVVDEE